MIENDGVIHFHTNFFFHVVVLRILCDINVPIRCPVKENYRHKNIALGLLLTVIFFALVGLEHFSVRLCQPWPWSSFLSCFMLKRYFVSYICESVLKPGNGKEAWCEVFCVGLLVCLELARTRVIGYWNIC